MIRFKCIYCGQRILAKDDGVGKRGKCPKCMHELVVPKSTKGRPAISANKEPMPERPAPYVPEWNKDPCFDPSAGKDAWTELFKESFGFLVPTYDKLSLLLMALTFILLFITNNQMRMFMPSENETSQTQSLIYTVKIFLLITILPIFILFQIFGQTDADFKKQIMLFFAVLINVYSGIIAGIYVISNIADSYWLLVFPIWNIINSILLLLMLFYNIIDEECISDRKVTASQIILGLVSVLVIFIFCNFIFKLYWAITFSICIIYTTSFDRALQSVFPGLSHREDEPNP